MPPPDRTPTLGPRLTRTRAVLACAGLAALYYAVAYLGVATKSPTYDEPMHALHAQATVRLGDLRLGPESPPLLSYWLAPAVLSTDLALPTGTPEWRGVLRDNRLVLPLALRTYFGTAGNGLEPYLPRARAVALLSGVALIALVAWWAGTAGGAVAAVVAGALVAVDANFLAHGPLVTSDVLTAAAFAAAALATWRVGRRATVLNVAGLAIACTCAVLAKMSGLLVGPIVVALLVFRAVLPQPWTAVGRDLTTRRRRLVAAGLILTTVAGAGYIGLWSAYRFRYAATPVAGEQPDVDAYVRRVARQAVADRTGRADVTDADIAGWRPGAALRAVLFVDRHRLLPQGFTRGLLVVLAPSDRPPVGYLLGEVRTGGWWYYFPVAIAVKTPVGTLVAVGVVIGLAGAARVRHVRRRRDDPSCTGDAGPRGAPSGRVTFVREAEPLAGSSGLRPDATQASPVQGARGADIAGSARQGVWLVACLLVPAAVYLLVAMGTNLNIGVRHVLPVYPPVFVAVGVVAGAAVRRWGRWAACVVAGLVAVIAVESLRVFPDFIPFFNVIAGGPENGIDLLGDSNLDWGQDLPALAARVDGRPIYLAYFGSVEPAAYGIRYQPVAGGYHLGPAPPPPLAPGPLAISATVLQGIYLSPDLRAVYAPLRQVEPTTVLGGSIYVYDADRWEHVRRALVERPSDAVDAER